MKSKWFYIINLVLLLGSCVKKQGTCFDGKKNGNETEIDCGGDCPVICSSSITNPPINNLCLSAVSTNSMKVNSVIYTLPYNNNYFTYPYYYMLRAYTSSYLSSTHYVMLHFYGYPSSTGKIYTATGSSAYPVSNSEVRVEVKISGFQYYPSGTVYVDPTQGTYATFMCNVTVGGYSLSFEVNAN